MSAQPKIATAMPATYDMDALYRQALARLGVARAQLGAAKPELEEATLSFERVKTLLEQSFVTKSEYDMASARLRRAAAAVRLFGQVWTISSGGLVRSPIWRSRMRAAPRREHRRFGSKFCT